LVEEENRKSQAFSTTIEHQTNAMTQSWTSYWNIETASTCCTRT